MSPRVDQVLALLSVPLLAALVAVQTLDGGERIVIDARVPALAVAGVLVWRRAPFLVVVLAAAATAALLRRRRQAGSRPARRSGGSARRPAARTRR